METLGNTQASEGREEFFRGAYLEWYNNPRIITYTMKSADTPIFNAWSQKVLALLAEWPTNEPYRALHDISSPGSATFFQTFRDYTLESVAVRADKEAQAIQILGGHQHPAKVAIVLSMSLSGRVGRKKSRMRQQHHPSNTRHSSAESKRSTGLQTTNRQGVYPTWTM